MSHRFAQTFPNLHIAFSLKQMQKFAGGEIFLKEKLKIYEQTGDFYKVGSPRTIFFWGGKVFPFFEREAGKGRATKNFFLKLVKKFPKKMWPLSSRGRGV